MKNILKHIAPFSIFKTLIDTDMETWKVIGYNIFIMFLPLIFVTGFIFLGCVVGTVILLKLPEHYYFPFVTGGDTQHMFDRLMLCFGIFICIFKKNL